MLLVSNAVFADYIFHADGSIFEAVIIKQTATSVTVKRQNGKAETIKGSDILRIRETPVIKKGLRILDLERGMMYGAHLVDESPFNYTFRMDYSSPEEFKVKKENALMMEASFDSVPEVLPGSRDVTLLWNEIPDAKRYVVCIAASSRYDRIVESASTSVVVKELKGNTAYRVIVCAQDSQGRGYGPSREIQFMTANAAPSVPEALTLKHEIASYKLEWKASHDEDGKVVSYRIYEKTGSKYQELGVSDSNEFVITGGDMNAVRSFAVTSVDDKKRESDYSKDIRTRESKVFSFSVEAYFAYPFGSLSDDYSYGKGLFLSGKRQNLILPELSLALSGGIIMFAGSGSAKGDLFPFTAELRYVYSPNSSINVFGACAAGPAYYGGIDSDDTAFSRWAAMTFLKGGAEMRAGALNVSALLSWGGFYESAGFHYFLGASIAAGAALDF
jgi:hypothetical protein